MLVGTDYSEKINTRYKCDRCKKDLGNDTRYPVYVKEKGDGWPKKKWDLCKRCYVSLKRGIEKGV